MQATEVLLTSTNPQDALQVRTRELPAPGPGQALVRVEATGVSFAEQQMRRGRYYAQPAFPFVPGYDLVGVVEALGPDTPGAPAVGQRVAALTLTGGWADRVVLDAADLVAVPAGLEPADVETLVVNGLTAWRMLHRSARVRSGDTVVVLGGAGGVGSVLVQLALHAGARVIATGSAGQQERLRELGAIPIDRRAEDVPRRVAELAPGGVAAVFDHVGGPGIVASWRMLARGGTLVSYGTASTRDAQGDPRLPVLALVARLTAWNALPNGRRATFFNLWAGKRRHPERFRRELRHDLEQVLALLADGTLRPQVAGRYPLRDAARALEHAERGGVTGKVLLLPG